MPRAVSLIYTVILSLLCASTGICLELQLVAGAGPSTQITTLFFNHFQRLPEAAGYSFEVPPRSTKHAGGIRASDAYLFGRTGRPLKIEEKAPGKAEIILGRIPLAFVAGSRAGVKVLSRAQFQDICTGKIANWKEAGGSDHKIILIGREKTEAAFEVLRADFPCLDGAHFDRILKRDHQVVHFLESEEGHYALSFGAKTNFSPEYHLAVDGLNSGLDVGLVYDLKNENHPVVVAAKKFAASNSWHNTVLSADYMTALEAETAEQ